MFGTPRAAFVIFCISALGRKVNFSVVKHDMHLLTPPTVLILLASLEYYGSAIFHADVTPDPSHPTTNNALGVLSLAILRVRGKKN